MIVDNDPQRIYEFFVSETGDGRGFGNFTGIGLEKEGEIVAGVIYDYFNGQSVNAHIAAKGKHWLNREFLWFMFYYPFEQMGVKRITGLVSASNHAAMKFDEHLGFVEEARLKMAAHDGSDMIVYVMFKENCKWLKR